MTQSVNQLFDLLTYIGKIKLNKLPFESRSISIIKVWTKSKQILMPKKSTFKL